jgi:uncharacterized protein with beta-barrel porin domain
VAHRATSRRQTWRPTIAAAVATAAFVAAPTSSQAANITNRPVPPPTESANSTVSSAFAQLELGSKFLKFLGDQGSSIWQGVPNAGGGGASEAPVAPRYRTWFEAYGLGSHTDPQGDFAGDKRHSYGGVAGFGMKVTPDAMIGVSVDQSHTKVDITGLPQQARFDLTQIGLNGVVEHGPWTFSAAAVYGFASIDSERTTIAGSATAAYKAHLWGGIAEASYFHAIGASRIVPKIGVDVLRVETDGFTETGGFGPASVSSQTAERARLFAGAEVGHTWLSDRSMVDLSAYGRVVDIVWQQVSNVNVTAAGGGIVGVMQGAVESRIGVDAGALASYRMSSSTRLYAGYDGRFRQNFHSHGGSLGIEFRW